MGKMRLLPDPGADGMTLGVGVDEEDVLSAAGSAALNRKKGRDLFAESLLDRPDNDHQDSAPDSAAQDIGDDAPDVRAGAARVPEPQRVQELAAQAAAQNAEDRVEHRAQGEFFEQAAGQISSQSAADQLNDQIHRVLHDPSI